MPGVPEESGLLLRRKKKKRSVRDRDREERERREREMLCNSRILI
jgi:hypothetical protein